MTIMMKQTINSFDSFYTTNVLTSLDNKGTLFYPSLILKVIITVKKNLKKIYHPRMF